MYISQLIYNVAKRRYRLRRLYLKHIFKYITPTVTTVRTGTGHTLRLLPRYDYVQREIFLQGQRENYEKHVVHWLKKNISTGSTVIEIGAHVGYYAVLISSLIDSGGYGIYVEPLPENYILLKHNLKANGITWARTCRAAVSNCNGLTEFFPANDSGRNSLRSDSVTDKQSISVTSITLDDLFRSFSIKRVDLLQIDVEGAECLVLDPSQLVLTGGSVPLILCEYHPKQLVENFGVAPNDFLHNILDLGFEIFELDAATAQEIKFDFNRDNINKYQQLVFRLR